MSDLCFHQLGLPQPDINLEVGSGSHAQQTAEIVARLEPAVLDQRPDLVLVCGDVNSILFFGPIRATLDLISQLEEIDGVESPRPEPRNWRLDGNQSDHLDRQVR